MSTRTINTDVLKEAFKTMKYNKETEHIKGQMGNLLKLSDEEVKAFMLTLAKNDKWGNLRNADREVLMNKLAVEIEQNLDSFIALERRGRGVSSTHVTQKSHPYLVATLRYYANFCEVMEENRKEVYVSKLPDTSCLSLIGYVLGPALAAGYRVVFITPALLGDIIMFIEMIAKKIGFPEGTISVLLGDVDFGLVCKYANVLSVFDKSSRKMICQKMLAVAPLSTPVVVFDNADLDSACESIISSTWKNQLIFGSIAKEVFVQETVYKLFVKKLKEKVAISDSGTNFDRDEDSLFNLISIAEKNGIEVFPLKTEGVLPQRIMFIGGRVVEKSTNIVPYISVVGFRNADEVIALANNNTQGLSASVWTENIGLGNYVAEKLDVCNVWMNSFNLYSPDIAFTPRKFSGKGYFGGIQGFNELRYNKAAIIFERDNIMLQGGEKVFLNAIASAKKGYTNWYLMPKYIRIRHFRGVIQYIENNINKFKSKIVTQEWLVEWKTFFYQYLESNYGSSISSPIKGYNLNISYNPRGVLVAEATDNIENHNKKILIAGILEGNSLIFLNNCNPLQEFYMEVSKKLPSGVLTVVSYFNHASAIALQNPDVGVYFNEYIVDEELESCNKFTTATSSWSDIHSKVTYVKNVWSNIGQGNIK